MYEKEALALLEQDGAIVRGGHVRLTSGRHSGDYVYKSTATMRALHTRALAYEMAKPYFDSDVDVVLVPAVGAIAFGQEIVAHLSLETGREILFVYTEKEIRDGDEIQTFQRPGYAQATIGKRVLIADDLTTTGGSIKLLLQALPEGAIVVGASVLGNRGGITAEQLGVPKLATVVTFGDMKSYPASDCPICREGKIPLIDPNTGLAPAS